jgi:protein TonB
MQEQQMLLLAQIRQQLAALPPPDPKQPSNTPEAVAREERGASCSSCWPRSNGA